MTVPPADESEVPVRNHIDALFFPERPWACSDEAVQQHTDARSQKADRDIPVLLGPDRALVLFRSVILNEPNLLYHHGFVIVNAWLLAKVTLLADHIRDPEALRKRPLIFPILLKSAVLSVLLIGFYAAEETLVGAWHGKTIAQSVPNIAGGGWRGPAVVVFIMFVGLIPFFAYRELARALGEPELHALVFGGGPKKTLSQASADAPNAHG